MAYTIATEPSDAAKASVGTLSQNASTFYLDVKCFLEGVQVPHSMISVSYGITAPPTCTLLIPAHKVIRDLPETTKIHVFFKDFLPTDAGVYEWRLLFDGELSSFSYSISPDGAYMQINGIHSAAYMHLMQLVSLDISQYICDPVGTKVGEATMTRLFSHLQEASSVVTQIMEKGKFECMADIVYQLMRTVLIGTGESATCKYYKSKLDNVDGAWKILKRIYGVSKKAADSTAVTYNNTYKSTETAKSSGMSYKEYQSTGLAKAGTSAYYAYSDWVSPNDEAAATEFKGMNASFVTKLDLMTKAYRTAYNMNDDTDFKFTFNSAFRSESYNASITGANGEPGAVNSRHTTGEAVDINTDNWSDERIETLIKCAHSQGLDTITSYEEGVPKPICFVHVSLGG